MDIKEIYNLTDRHDVRKCYFPVIFLTLSSLNLLLVVTELVNVLIISRGDMSQEFRLIFLIALDNREH